MENEIKFKIKRVKLYRCFFKRLIKGRVSFFVGTSVIENMREVHNFCFYQEFDKFLKNFKGVKGLYNISARIYNKSVGNISLLLCSRINVDEIRVVLFEEGEIAHKLFSKFNFKVITSE